MQSAVKSRRVVRRSAVDRRGGAFRPSRRRLLAATVTVLTAMAVPPARADVDRVAPEPPSVLVGDEAASGDRGLRNGRLRVATASAADRPADPAGKAAEAKKAAGPCGEAAVECREALEKLRLDALASIDLDIRVGGRAGNDYPCECRLEGAVYEPRRFASTIFTWKAPGYCHKPLYFEHWALERYGHSRGFVADSFCSAAHFFVTLPVLPYKMGVELPWECVYPLGYYRPGNCAPWTVPAVPISGRGLAVQAATVTGLVFLLP